MFTAQQRSRGRTGSFLGIATSMQAQVHNRAKGRTAPRQPHLSKARQLGCHGGHTGATLKSSQKCLSSLHTRPMDVMEGVVECDVASFCGLGKTHVRNQHFMT